MNYTTNISLLMPCQLSVGKLYQIKKENVSLFVLTNMNYTSIHSFWEVVCERKVYSK